MHAPGHLCLIYYVPRFSLFLIYILRRDTTLSGYNTEITSTHLEATTNFDINTFFSDAEISSNGIDDTSTHLDTTTLGSTLPFTSSASRPPGNISLEPSSTYLSQTHEISDIVHYQDFLTSNSSRVPPESTLQSNESTSSLPPWIQISNGYHPDKPFAEETHVVTKLTGKKIKCDRCSTKKIPCSCTFPCKKCIADSEDCAFSKSRKDNPGTCRTCVKRKIRCVGDGAVCYACKYRSPRLCIPAPKNHGRRKSMLIPLFICKNITRN